MDAVAPQNRLDLYRVEEISSLPNVLERIMRVMADEHATLGDMEQALASDPPLVMQVLRLANSPAFTVGRRVDSLHLALVLLGFETVRNLAAAAGMARLFCHRFEYKGYRRGALWHHCVAVGVCNRMIARRFALMDCDLAFLAGLLHDIGVIVEDQYAHDAFLRALDIVADHEADLCEAERRVLGADHCQHGASLAMRWSLSGVLADCIRFHHAPQQCDTAHSAAAGALHLSDLLCAAHYRYPLEHAPPPERTAALLKRLGIGAVDIKVLLQDLDDEVRAVQPLLDLAP